MKLRLIHSPSTKGSKSLKDLAYSLSANLGYKVWRSSIERKNRAHVYYGHSVNKLHQYMWFVEKGIPCLEYTTDPAVAKEWVTSGATVFGRKLLNSSCGKGIVVFEKPEDVVPCPVYTKYRKKKREFRVHIFQQTVVAVTEKKRRKEFDGVRDTKIRNLANGYVFVQNVENEPEGLRELALKASEVSSSDFRGVDVGYNEKKDELFIIEVNSAPGIQGSNINAYAKAIIGV